MLLPLETSGVSSELSMFDTLVSIGEERTLTSLPHQLHAFLVACLLDHMRDVEITHQVLAQAFLESRYAHGAECDVRLKRIGDGALILAGFFPERALRLHVSSSYFSAIGQSAYGNLGMRLLAVGKSDRGAFYDAVAKSFAVLARVLRGARAAPHADWEAYRRFRADLC